MPSFGSLRGFRDYLPPDAGARSEIRRRLRAVARRCGYTELETPSVESLELFQAKSGEEIGAELWTFTDKGGRAVTLVAETTPSLARVYVDRSNSEPLPVKWVTLAKLWRYEEPQSGRTREFGQCNLDILGVPGIQAEADLLSTAALMMDEVGAQGLYGFRINDRELIEEVGRALGAGDLPRFFRALDRSAKQTAAESRGELAAAGLDDAAIDRLLAWIAACRAPSATLASALTAAGDLVGTPRAQAAAARLRALWELLAQAEIADRCRFEPTVVRGLAYYTSTVFEAFDARGDLRALFGGGRYDGLIELFGGAPTPACGLAIGDQTLEVLLRAHARWPAGEPPLDTYVVAVSAAEVPLATQWVQRLRRAGIAADGDLMGRSLSRQLREAARRKARRALILGPKELARGVIVERDLTSGAQRELAPDAVLPPA